MNFTIKVKFPKVYFVCLLGFLAITVVANAHPIRLDDADISGVIIRSIAWNPTTNQIAMGKGHVICSDTYYDPRFAIQILNGDTDELVNSIVSLNCTATSLAWSPDGTMLVSATDDASIWFWDAVTGAFLSQDAICCYGASSLWWSPDSKKVYGIGAGSTFVYDVSAKAGSSPFDDNRLNRTTAIALNPDGSQLASGDQDGIIRIFDTSSKQTVLSFAPQTSAVMSLDWSPDGSILASGFENGNVKVFTASGDLIFQLSGHTDSVSVVGWSPNGDRLASASHDGTVRFWDTTEGTELGLLEYPGRVLTLDWSPDGDRVAYGGIRSDFEDTQPQIVSAPTIPTSTPTASESPTPTPTTVGN